MNTIKKALYDNYKAAAEAVMPDLTNSNFIKTGMLTKDEFKVAGDNLVQMDSEWIWYKVGVCLMKQNVVCQKIRLNKVENNTGSVNEFDMSIYEYNENDKEPTIDINDNNDNTENNTKPLPSIDMDDESSDDDLLAELEDKTLMQEDAATVKILPGELKNIPNYYNVYITYDQYYRTPRIWFVGSSIDGCKLSQKETYKDFMPEYLNISLTMELNPILNMHCTSVHPCKHAYAMQRMFAYDMENKDTSEIRIENYLVYFLKFASSVIPQLEFDRTSIPS
jgi:ubiquitin-like-conjugating enzyme ATG3